MCTHNIRVCSKRFWTMFSKGGHSIQCIRASVRSYRTGSFPLSLPLPFNSLTEQFVLQTTTTKRCCVHCGWDNVRGSIGRASNESGRLQVHSRWNDHTQFRIIHQRSACSNRRRSNQTFTFSYAIPQCRRLNKRRYTQRLACPLKP